MEALFYPPNEERSCSGVLRVYLTVGRFDICIEFSDLQEDNSQDEIRSLIEDNGFEVSGDGPSFLDPRFKFGSHGLIFIEENNSTANVDDSHLDNIPLNDLAEMVNAEGSMPNLFQMDCFNTTEGVPATIKNLLRAIYWCDKNQNYMREGGV